MTALNGPVGTATQLVPVFAPRNSGNHAAPGCVTRYKEIPMRITPLVCSLALLASLALPLRAESDWQKSYPLQGKPALMLSTGDTALEIRSCGSCSQLSIRVAWNDRKPSDYILTESQTGTSIAFTLKEKPTFGIHLNLGSHHAPRVTVDSPVAADIEAHTADGSLSLSGIQGSLDLHTADGAVDVSDTTGSLRLKSSDGSVRIHNATGTLETHSADGGVHIDGRFSQLQVHTGDGALDLTLAEGSQLTAPSRIEGSDGYVRIHLPRTLAADLDVSTSDGGLDCQLPVTTIGKQPTSDSHHQIHGKLNGGGTDLAIKTSDGGVQILPL